MTIYSQNERQEELEGFWSYGKKDKEEGKGCTPPPAKLPGSFLEPGEEKEMSENREAYLRGYNGETL